MKFNLMKILDSQLVILSFIKDLGSPSYSKAFEKIKKNKRKYRISLPISKGMLYKRSFELRNKGFLETKAQKVFPSFSILQLTEKALVIIKTLPILKQLLNILTDKINLKAKIIKKNKTNKKKKQTDLFSFIKENLDSS